MAGDPTLAHAYAEALRLYAKDVTTMALAAECGTRDDHARAALRTTATWQNEVEPARRAWEVTVPVDYEISKDREG
jgi:hypothetical protein